MRGQGQRLLAHMSHLDSLSPVSATGYLGHIPCGHPQKKDLPDKPQKTESNQLVKGLDSSPLAARQ